MSTVQAYEETLLAQGYTYTSQIRYPAVAQGGPTYTGIQTGEDGMVLIEQYYGSSEEAVTVSLYELTFTGGAATRTTCRNQATPKPIGITVLSSVVATPNTPLLESKISSSTVGNSAQLSLTKEGSNLYLKPNTKYVLGMVNDSAQVAALSANITFRETVNGQ